jgi:hypothetical protein
MAMNVLSYQMKKKNNLIAMQLFGSLLFSANYLMLGALMGGIMNILAVIRAIVFINIKKWHLNRNLITALFIAAFITSYVLAFTVFGTEPSFKNFIIEALPVIGMSAVTVSFGMSNAAKVRLIGITANSPGWLIYNIFAGSIGAGLCEVFSLISLAVGIIRHDIKRKTADSDIQDQAKD